MKRRALITGVSGGIGSATAQAFLNDKWDVIGLDVNPPPTDLADNISFHLCDLSDRAQTIATLQRSLAEQPLHALVNNAAVQLNKSLKQTSDAEWDLLMAINFGAAFVCIRECHEALVAARGSVVNVSSVHGVATSSNVAAYTTSKGALLALTRAASIELSEAGVRCNAVLPGATDTQMLRDGLKRRPHPEGPEGNLQKIIERTPLHALATASDIAQAILFLSSPATSSFITGQTLIVDGGASVQLSTE